ncbi:MAG: hypothetical protein V4622_08000 [Bacteroidota bacterium]
MSAQEFNKGYVGFSYLNTNLVNRPGNLQLDMYARSINKLENISLPKRMDGMTFTFMGVKEISENAEVFGEMEFANRSFITEKSASDYELKVRINTLKFISTGGRIHIFRFGFSLLDINRITIKQKGVEFENTGLSKWVPYYQKKTITNFGSTFKLGFHFPLGDFAAFELLGIYQTMWFPNKFSIPFRANNLGISASLLINFMQ